MLFNWHDSSSGERIGNKTNNSVPCERIPHISSVFLYCSPWALSEDALASGCRFGRTGFHHVPYLSIDGPSGCTEYGYIFGHKNGRVFFHIHVSFGGFLVFPHAKDSKGNSFWGCPKYPQCRGTRQASYTKS